MTRDRDSSNDRRDEPGVPTNANSRELEARIDDLESTLRELRRESLRPPRGPFGLPRPPTPREFAEFTDRHAIPTTIAFLEAHIRALQALQAALRVVRGADETRERTTEARARTEALGRRTIDALDSALDDFADVIEAGRLPEDGEARSVLVDARRLTEEIRAELETAKKSQDENTGGSPASESSEQRDGVDSSRGRETHDPRIDPSEIETELDVLRDEVDADGAGDDEGDGAGDDEGDDADTAGSAVSDRDEDEPDVSE